MTQTFASRSASASEKSGIEHRRFSVTHVRPGDSDSGEVQYDIITAPSAAAANLRASQIFRPSRILAVDAIPEPLPVRAAQDAPMSPPSPGARFIHGMFRQALFTDERELEQLCS